VKACCASTPSFTSRRPLGAKVAYKSGHDVGLPHLVCSISKFTWCCVYCVVNIQMIYKKVVMHSAKSNSMSRISSIGTATNSNLAGIGLSLNITGRACMANASKTGSSAQKIKDGNADVKRHDGCLTASARNKSAYVPVISTDTVAVSALYARSNAYSKLTIPEANPSILDMTMATCYRKVGDAR